MSQTLVNAWYKGHWALVLLRPLSLLYRAVTSIRRLGYQRGYFASRRFDVPVIVVGNITAGGTGKTPLTLAIVDYLKQQGYKPAIVSRGYGGQTQYPAQVTEQSTAQQVGDEPLLMFLQSRVPVVVAPKRAEAVAYIQAKQLANVVVCDDGLQHYALARDIEIAVIDGARGLGNGKLLPEGALRETPSRLNSVDFVVVNGHGYTHPQAYQMNLQASAWQSVAEFANTQPPKPSQTVHAVAGIGNPERFFMQLEAQGFKVIKHAFADHHQYTAQDIDFGDELPIVMTAKDAVKCKSFANDKMWQVPVLAQLSDGFYQQLINKLDFKNRANKPC